MKLEETSCKGCVLVDGELAFKDIHLPSNELKCRFCKRNPAAKLVTGDYHITDEQAVREILSCKALWNQQL